MNKYESMQAVKNMQELFLPKTKRLNIKNLKKIKAPLSFPLVIKPNSLGSSVLVFIVENQKEYEKAIKEYEKKNVNDVLAQELISGIELSCGCLQTKNDKIIELPPIEIKPKSSFFDYTAKYEIGGSEEITPPISISKKESDKISSLTAQIHKKLNCSTYSRSDFIYKNGKNYFLETNTLPGFTATSLLPQEAQAKNMTFSELINFIIEQSL